MPVPHVCCTEVIGVPELAEKCSEVSYLSIGGITVDTVGLGNRSGTDEIPSIYLYAH